MSATTIEVIAVMSAISTLLSIIFSLIIYINQFASYLFWCAAQRFATSSPLHRPDVLREGILAGGRVWTKLREQDSTWAWKMLENAAESHPSSARGVSRLYAISDVHWTLNFCFVDC
jgi:hypothetical protein